MQRHTAACRWTLALFSKNESTQKIQCAGKKNIGISIHVFFFLSFFFLLIHGTLSFLPKDFLFFVFYIEILRHFSNPALVYNTGCSDQQMNGGNTEGLVPQACMENGTPGAQRDIDRSSSGMALLLFVNKQQSHSVMLASSGRDTV